MIEIANKNPRCRCPLMQLFSLYFKTIRYLRPI